MFASAGSRTLLPLFVIATLESFYSRTRKSSPSNANVSINLVFPETKQSTNTKKINSAERNKGNQIKIVAGTNIGAETNSDNAKLRLLENSLSDAQDVSFGLAATSQNGWEWNKQVNYGEEISLKAPVGSVSFLMRLAIVSYPASAGAT